MKLRHPKGLWIIATAAALMSYSTGTINSILILYLTDSLHFSASKAYELFAAFNSLLFTLPLIGGYLAQKLGYYRAFLTGLTLGVISLLLLSLNSKISMYFGLGFYDFSAALFVPTYLVLQGKLYAKDDSRRDGAYTLAYIISNIGFTFTTVLTGYIITLFNFSWGFIVGAVVMMLIYPVYFLGKKHIKIHSSREIEPQWAMPPMTAWVVLAVTSAAITSIATWLLMHTAFNRDLLFIVIIAITGLIITVACKQKSAVARKRLIAFIILSYISVGFWALYTLEPSFLTIFIKNNVNRHVFNSIIPPSSFYGLDSFFIIIMGGFFSWLWLKLAERNRDPSLPAKFSASLFSMGSGFLILIVGIYFANSFGYSSMIWIFLAYFLLSTAELLISPIGQAMVGRLAPEGMEGSLMGAWQVFIGLAGIISGYLAQLAIVPRHVTPLESNPVYAQAFAKIGLMAIGLSIIAMLLTPYIKKLVIREG